jgi:hypothetical protein
MAIPLWTFADNFESGSNAGWDSETDTESQLDFPHYTELARTPGMAMPFSGAYCMRLSLTGSGAPPAAAVLVAGDVNINTTETHWFKFNMWVDPNFKVNTTAADNFALLELQEGANDEIFAFGLDYNSTTDKLTFAVGGAATNAVPNTLSSTEVPLGKWMTVELKVHLVSAGATGDITAYVTVDGGEPSATATVTKASVQGVTITHAWLGVQDHKITTLGTILIDNFSMDGNTTPARIYPDKDRFSCVRTITGNEHVFVGPGTITNVTLASTANDNIITIYDTDTAQTHQGLKKLVISNHTAAQTVDAGGVPFDVVRGCYVETTAGADFPEVTLTIGRATGWFSEGNMRRYAHQRRV